MRIYTKDEWMKNSKSLHVMQVDPESALNRPVLEISPIGRSTPLYAPLVLLG